MKEKIVMMNHLGKQRNIREEYRKKMGKEMKVIFFLLTFCGEKNFLTLMRDSKLF